MVPLGEKAVPFFSVSDDVRESFEQNVAKHPSVERIVEVTRYNGERLYSLDWNVARDVFFQQIIEKKTVTERYRHDRDLGVRNPFSHPRGAQ